MSVSDSIALWQAILATVTVVLASLGYFGLRKSIEQNAKERQAEINQNAKERQSELDKYAKEAVDLFNWYARRNTRYIALIAMFMLVIVVWSSLEFRRIDKRIEQ